VYLYVYVPLLELDLDLDLFFRFYCWRSGGVVVDFDLLQNLVKRKRVMVLHTKYLSVQLAERSRGCFCLVCANYTYTHCFYFDD